MHKHNSRHNSHPAEPENEEIARLAYSFFEAEGRLDGHDFEHWVRAREQLSQSSSLRKRAEKDAGRERTSTSHDGEVKAVSVSPPRGQREERYVQASAGQ
jgi:hypothetical protein